MNLSDADVQEIIRLLDDSGYDELEIETAGFRLVLQRSEDRTGWSRQRETLARPHRADAYCGTDATAGSGAAKPQPTSVAGGGAQPIPQVATGAGERADAGLNDGLHDGPNDGPIDGLWAIRSPIVGTFYRAPRPGSDPFVQPGSRVQPDTVVAIIEVMKLMNSVAAGMDGEVVEIVVEDGQLIEKGQCLMRVRPLNNPLNPLDGQAG
jgi:acetyl-CoA carboxylase biotin carboxyl carrier protein